MALIRPIGIIIGVFVMAVAVGLWLHPIASLLFIAVAKIIEIMWISGSQAYRQTNPQETSSKQKRQRLIHTHDGEMLEIVDEAERVSSHG